MPDPVRDRGGLAAIEVDTFAFAASLTPPSVTSDMHARFSLPVSLATFAARRRARRGRVPARPAGPRRGGRAGRPGAAARGAGVHRGPAARTPDRGTVRWRDGSAETATVRNARGNPTDPLTPDEVAAKFRRNAEDVLTPATADAVVAGLLNTATGNTLRTVANEVLGRFTP